MYSSATRVPLREKARAAPSAPARDCSSRPRRTVTPLEPEASVGFTTTGSLRPPSSMALATFDGASPAGKETCPGQANPCDSMKGLTRYFSLRVRTDS